MRSLGFATFRLKLLSFVIAGTLAGLAGYLDAAQFGVVNPDLLGWRLSGTVLMMVILGGMGTLYGPVLGAFALVLLQDFLSDQTKHWLLPMGLFIILAVLGLAVDDSLTHLNALKQVIALSTNLAAAIFFIFSGNVLWPAAIVMAVGALIGGALGGKLAGRIKPSTLRWVVVTIGVIVSIIYFVK
jgi:hypothetical protein